MQILPLCYLELSEEELHKYECSDSIWLPRSEFERLTHSSDPGIAIILKLTNSVGQSTYGYMHSFHTDDPNILYIPQWMFELLDLDTDNVHIEKASPALCTGITVVPHTSDASADPETILRDAFESYTCLIKGNTYNLWLGDHSFTVTVLNYQPEDQEVVCIRNCELVLELLPPLDLPIPPPPVSVLPTTAVLPTVSPSLNPSEVIANQVALGIRPDAAELRRIMAEAALKRLAAATDASTSSLKIVK